MGFLDDLKRQAGDLRASQDTGQAQQQRSLQLVEAAARDLHRYLMELAGQLDVIRPAAPVRYLLDKQVVVEGPRDDYRFDARRKILHDQEVIDHVVLACQVRSGRRVALAKDFVNEIESLEARLAQAGITFEREPVRHPEHGKLIEMRYEFVADVQISVHARCEHDSGSLLFTLRNLDGLETVTCRFPAHDVGQARLDELARWCVGQPHRFLDGAQALRRVEAR